MMITYYLPTGVESTTYKGRPVLTTPQGGRVAVDHKLLSLWKLAAGKTLPEILAGASSPETDKEVIKTAMSCLVHAGLLEGAYLDKVSPNCEIVAEKISVLLIPRKSI